MKPNQGKCVLIRFVSNDYGVYYVFLVKKVQILEINTLFFIIVLDFKGFEEVGSYFENFKTLTLS